MSQVKFSVEFDEKIYATVMVALDRVIENHMSSVDAKERSIVAKLHIEEAVAKAARK